MGSEGIKRRKRRRRLPAVDDDAVRGNWELQHSPYTFEGQMEGLGRLGRGMGSASPRMRLMAKIVVAAFLLPLVLGFVYWLID